MEAWCRGEGQTSCAGESLSLLLVTLFMVVCRSRLGLGDGFAGHTIFAFNPATQVYELTSFRTEGAKGVFFPLDRFTAGWTVHLKLRAACFKPEMRAA